MPEKSVETVEQLSLLPSYVEFMKIQKEIQSDVVNNLLMPFEFREAWKIGLGVILQRKKTENKKG